MKFISKKAMAFFLIIATIIQVFLVVSASDSFEVKCTIEDIKKSDVSVEVYDITELDETIVKKGANEIFKHLQNNSIKPNVKGYFNEKGVFAIDGLDGKLLLIKSGDFYKNNILYKAIPQVIDSSKIGSLEIVETKYEFEAPRDSSVTYTVKKEWYEENSIKHNEISVSIFHGGVIYDTVYLSDKNNWTYQWSGAKDNDWYVKENEVPEGYTVSYSQDSTVFQITNIADEAYYKYIKENGIPKTYKPQTGLESILENMGSRVIIIILCVIVSSTSFIVGRKTNKKRR